MNVTEIKTLLEKQVPVILRDSPDFQDLVAKFHSTPDPGEGLVAIPPASGEP